LAAFVSCVEDVMNGDTDLEICGKDRFWKTGPDTSEMLKYTLLK
jgi:hypothetical protein